MQQKYPTNKYTLNTKELYGFDKTVEINNVYIFPNRLLLISILPNLEGKENWKKADRPIPKDEIFTQKQFEDWYYSKNTKNKELYYNKIIKTINGQQYVSIACLIEKFNIGDYPYPFVSEYGTINIVEPKVSVKEMEKAYYEKYTKFDRREVFPLDVREQDHIIDTGKNFLFRTYSSKEYLIKKEKAYQFWTFVPWGVIDGYNVQRGIDRFIYIPGKGIVGGSYDFYFALRPKLMFDNDIPLPVNDDKLWDNIINEKVMLAEELK